MDAEARLSGQLRREGPSPGVVALQALALIGAATLIGATAGHYDWNVGTLLVIAGMAVFSDLTAVQVSGKLVLGQLPGDRAGQRPTGEGPAALVGTVTIAGGWFRWREPRHKLINNLVTFAWFPLLSGLFFHAMIQAAHAGHNALPYYMFVFVTFLVALAANFLGIAAYQCYLDGISLVSKAREALVPVLSAELFSALLTLVAVVCRLAAWPCGPRPVRARPRSLPAPGR